MAKPKTGANFSETGRKLVHLFYGILLGIAVLLLGKEGSIVLIACILAGGLVAIAHREKIPLVKFVLEKFSRKEEPVGQGPVSFTLGALLALSFFGKTEAGWGIIFLGIGDSLSAIFGRLSGARKKSWQGFLAGFAGNLLAGHFFSPFPVVPLLISAGAVSVFEFFAPKEIDDNLLIPAIGAFFLSIGGAFR